MSKLSPKKCPQCQSKTIKKRRPLNVLVGFVVVLICGLLAVPTLGVSLIFMIWGVFLLEPKHRCSQCDWKA